MVVWGLVSFVSSNAIAQSQGINYIHTWDFQEELLDESSIHITTPVSMALQTIQYFDGLARPIQTVQKCYTPSGEDLVQPTEYNDIGKDENRFLPFKAKQSTGNYVQDYRNELNYFYLNLYNDPNGKSPIHYERSPLFRILEEGFPGQAWQLNNHSVKYEHLSNENANEILKVKLWKINGDQCCLEGNYRNGELYCTKRISEDNALELTFTDKLGKLILKRSVLDSIPIDTYYVYDDMGLLRIIISPEGSRTITESFYNNDPIASKYIYCYKYDFKKRLIEKRIPGKENEYFIYNSLDQVVLTQDGNMRQEHPGENVWLFNKYDSQGRTIMTGRVFLDNLLTIEKLLYIVDNQKCCFETNGVCTQYPMQDYNYYSNRSFPDISGHVEIYTIIYFGTYNINLPNGQILPMYPESFLNFNPQDAGFVIADVELSNIGDLQTLSLINYGGLLFPTVIYYDKYNRIIQSRTLLDGKGYDIYSYNYKGITPLITQSEHKHSWGITSLNEREVNLYDDIGRLIRKEYELDTLAMNVVLYDYNALSQVVKKTFIEDSKVLQEVDYEYNIRGWMQSINDPQALSDDYFGMELLYDKVDPDLGNQATFSGNISASKYNMVQPSHNITFAAGLRAYTYEYDDLSRFKSAIDFQYIQGVWRKSQKCDEYINEYDYNGNIKRLQRYGLKRPNNTFGLIDDLTYFYDGNRIKAIDDNVDVNNMGDFYDNYNYYKDNPEYKYDNNGNLIMDINKGIVNISYNHLNLPICIEFSGGSRIEYRYNAIGEKRQQRLFKQGLLEKTTHFVSNFVYENYHLVWNNFGDGRVMYSNGKAIIEYYITDHLGNVRIAFSKEGDERVIRQVNNYYPFGMNIRELSGNLGIKGSKLVFNEYLYNGKMYQDELGLGWYDHGARFYDGVVGRWWSVDPLAEKYYSISSYAHVVNNPIRYIDPDGRDVWEVNSRGKVVNHIETTEHDAFYMIDKKGNRIEGKELMFEYGTVENFKSQYSDEAKTTFDWYNVRGDNNGKQLFEFFANNTTVEWSQLLLGQKGDNGLNIVSTSHEKSKERSVNFLLDNQYKFGYTIKGHNHNHPSNTPYPSGLNTRGSDIGFANKLTNFSLNNGSGVPTFNIYLLKTGKYVRYNRNSTIFDFPDTSPIINLPEIQIVAPIR